MKLFLFRTEYFDYDEFDSHVVAAESSKRAVTVAALPGDREQIHVEYIGEYYINKEEIVHSSFHHG